MTEIESIAELEVWYHDQLVGRMALTQDQRCAFQYDQNYLKEGVSLSPFHLPASPELFIAPPTPFEGNFGVFADSLPDGWGSLVLDRYLRNAGLSPAALTILQRLSLVGSNARGALEYRPDNSIRGSLRSIDLVELARQVEELYQSKDYNDEALETVYRYSGSSGGARPKVFITSDGDEWLVKFPASIDPDDVGVQEYEYSLLAKRCGIVMPETCLFDDRYFATQRFDRSPQGKIHTLSAAGLLHADYRIPSLDYATLLIACQRLTRDMREVEQLFRLMVFNVVIGNRDDHAKNFSFQLHGRDWKLAPAYDLLPSYGFNGQHTTTINGSGDPHREDLLACGAKVGLKTGYMDAVIDEIVRTCRSERMAKNVLSQT